MLLVVLAQGHARKKTSELRKALHWHLLAPAQEKRWSDPPLEQ